MAIQWNKLISAEQVHAFSKATDDQYILIFKHSTRCGISFSALDRLESKWNIENVQAWYLDLLNNRDISNLIADTFKVYHQSPQIILLQNGKVIHHTSHHNISVEDLQSVLT